jgi:hypothetical protein
MAWHSPPELATLFGVARHATISSQASGSQIDEFGHSSPIAAKPSHCAGPVLGFGVRYCGRMSIRR